MSNTWVALKLKTGAGFCVHPTKFDRKPGDSMVVDGEAYVVIATGERFQCVHACNEQIAIINEATKARNRVFRSLNSLHHR